ncbi:ABC transporter ATP-binding protein [Clostridium niameyense]|uniref:ABC transporter ATP-binding protein n=1 Tax=Clostridium niameyense TaxID=1622073 RepID=A0A6M0R987_9CLOT|nr:ABC transporter ATP-binding protein [Clostridium niameyense]NEZ46347.1 ABC transporter ATP-binding protein [Clostridium niameyense]
MENRTNIFKNLIWVAKYTFSFEKKYIFVLVIAMFITGIIPPLSTLVAQSIINELQTKSNLNIILSFVIIYVFIDLFESLFNCVLGYYKSKFFLAFNLHFSEVILKKASRLDLKSYENSETYDMINRAQYEGNGKLVTYLETFMGIFSKVITMITYLCILITFKSWIVICIIVIPVVKFLVSKKINIMSFNLIKNRTNDSRKCWYIQYVLTYGDFYKELKTYNLFNYFIKRYKGYTKKFNKDDIYLEKKNSIFFSIITIFEIIIDGILFSYIVFNGFIGKILIGNVLTYMKTISQIKEQMTNILQTLSEMNKESLFIDQLINYFNLPEVIDKGSIKIDKIENIKIKNLNYKYREEQDYVLKNINLEIKNNEIVAIVGQNGSGKTTLIKILMGFYDDYEGEIYVNDINLREIDKKAMLGKMATLFQDFVKYEATFRENISYGNLKVIDNDDRLYNISNKFGLNELIRSSNKGLDCQIGCWFDNGKQISLGQWQKVALARAFAKEADLYILDEPNSALDAISEYELSISYSKLLENSIGIIVAHKFNNFIKNVDKIIILSNGEISGEGKHNYLINANETYKKLYEIQIGTLQE